MSFETNSSSDNGPEDEENIFDDLSNSSSNVSIEKITKTKQYSMKQPKISITRSYSTYNSIKLNVKIVNVSVKQLFK